jgi:hypothetical protein
MKSRSILRVIVTTMLALSLPATAGPDEEVVIHRGKEFNSPGLGLKEEIRFVREFAVNRETRNEQPEFHPPFKPPLSSAKATELAQATLDASASDGYGEVRARKLELLHHPTGKDGGSAILFYVVDFIVDGSEVQRLVLMDGTVVKPRLTKLPDHQEPQAAPHSPR